MAADNSTGDLHAPGTPLSVTDIIVIAVYFALNLAVGIWVRTCSGPLGSRRRTGASMSLGVCMGFLWWLAAWALELW